MKLLPIVVSFALAFGSCAVMAQNSDAKPGADRHVANGVTCDKCHGANNEVKSPNIDQCVQCHVPEQVAEKTKEVKPNNPHVSPHYGTTLDCVLCHSMHSEPSNFCSQCHSFDFKVK